MTTKQVLKTTKKPTGAAAKGAGPGRPKGLANKVPTELKAMILQALDKAGGVSYLLECALNEKTQGAFLSLIGKVLPMTIAGTGADGEHVITVIERRIVKAHD
jgi:hypothetical protein